MTTHTTSAIEMAVALSDGVANLAEACGVSAQAVYKWIKKGYPPTKRCAAVELAVGGKVSRFDLLPPPFMAAKRTIRAVEPPPAIEAPTVPP